MSSATDAHERKCLTIMRLSRKGPNIIVMTIAGLVWCYWRVMCLVRSKGLKCFGNVWNRPIKVMNCVPVDLVSDSITLQGKARKAIVFVWTSHNVKGIVWWYQYHAPERWCYISFYIQFDSHFKFETHVVISFRSWKNFWKQMTL